MSRDKSVWFAEEILLDAKLINYQLESGEWDAVEEMLRAEAQLSRDADTGRLRPKKASEYTLRLVAEVLHIMRLDVEQGSHTRATLAVAEQCLRLVRSCAAAGTKIKKASEYTLRLVAEVLHIMRLDVEQGSHTRATLAVAEQCLRLVRSCAAAGTKMQTYVSKDLSILDSMLALATQYHHTHVTSRALLQQYDSCMTVLVQTLGNLVVNNPFNQIIVWDKFDSVILSALVGANERTASAAAMAVYNILLGQPHVLPDDVLLLNSLAYMYANGNTEYPDLIIEYLIGVENTYIEKLYSKLEPECRVLVLSLAYNILMSHETQDINVSVNFVRFMAHEFKGKSDLILKTVDKYVRSVEPQEVVFLLDILATASSMDAYLDTLQSDVSLFINCAFLLRAIHKLGKESDNFFSSVSKLYADAGRPVPSRVEPAPAAHADAAQTDIALCKNDSADNMLSCNETTSECTESESSEQYYECTEAPPPAAADCSQQHGGLQLVAAAAPAPADSILNRIARAGSADRSGGGKLEQELVKVAFAKSMAGESAAAPRKVSLEHKIDIDDGEPPLILDPASPHDTRTIAEVIPVKLESLEIVGVSGTAEAEAASSQENSPDEPLTEIHLKAPEMESPSEVSPPLADGAADSAPSGEQREVKKSQNLSTDFNLSEQLEKILGISTGAARSEGGATEARRGGGAQDGRTAERAARTLPSVKIHSPDNQSSRLGETDASNVKRCASSVSSVEQHVAFGFKAALVRLLANLCWKHPANKRQMRELEVIPVLLDCCNIDARNPLIMQWVIYAVRNLCENCPENQEVISQLTLKAPVQSELLQEMGLSLHTDAAGNTLRIAPLPRNNP